MRLAAAIEISEYSGWAGGYARRPAGVYGRTDVVDGLGAVASTDLAEHDGGYARLTHPKLINLPELLAAYLRAYAAVTGTGT